MKLIRPKHINNSYLLSSNVLQADSRASTSSRTITSSSVANPTIITTDAHSMVGGTNAVVTISGHTGSTPDINGEYLATVTSSTQFSIPVNVTVGGTGGTAVVSAYESGTAYALGQIVQVDSPAVTVTMTIASPCVVTRNAHGFEDDDIIIFTTTGALPTGITAGKHYYIRVLTANTFNISSELLNFQEITTSGTQSGTHRGTVSTHKVYESLGSGHVGNTPRSSPTFWLDLGDTNRWKMFDRSVASRTTNADSIAITLQPTGRCDSVALINISADTVNYRMTDSGSGATVTMTIATPCVVTDTGHTKIDGDMVRFSTTGDLPTGLVVDTTYYVVNAATDTYELSATSGGASIDTSGTQSGTHTVKTVVYDETYSLTYDGGIDNWYSYFFEPIFRSRDNVEIDMPHYIDPIIDITLTGTGELVSCGACIIGTRLDFGPTQLGARSGIDNYSVKTRDNFGNYNILERAFSKRADFTSWINNGRIGAMQDTLSDYRATPIVYIGEESLTNMIIYGFYKDFSIDIAYPDVSICTTTIEGLT